jgi:hypothetical protein
VCVCGRRPRSSSFDGTGGKLEHRARNLARPRGARGERPMADGILNSIHNSKREEERRGSRSGSGWVAAAGGRGEVSVSDNLSRVFAIR